MYAKDLIGKMAIRSKPAGNDRSYMSEGLKILAVTDSHIVYKHQEGSIFSGKRYVLDSLWNDDGWEDYDDLMKLADINDTCEPQEMAEESEPNPETENM